MFAGVESGVCDRETLLKDSDYVVEDIHDILDVVLPGRLHTDEMSRFVLFWNCPSLTYFYSHLACENILLALT